eukprot:13590377-Ditylum_brightwellii.AAC.1
MGFTPSIADQDLWIHKSEEYNGYDNIATHVDDLIIVSKNPLKYMNYIEQHFQVHDVTDSPKYYLGNDVVKRGNRIFRKYQEKYGSVTKENLPIKPTARPEHKEYQHIIGVGQWLVVSGRYDIMYAVSSLSRFSAAPIEGHLELARKLIGYLKKYPKRGYAMNHHQLNLDLKYEK